MNMLAIGVDIEDISRFENKTIENDSKFLFRIFTKNEIDYCFKNKYPKQHLAGRYCAKEAAVKALSSISRKLVPYNKIEILPDENSVPQINIYDEEFKKYKFHLSISHERNKAIAFVVVE